MALAAAPTCTPQPWLIFASTLFADFSVQEYSCPRVSTELYPSELCAPEFLVMLKED